MPTLQEVLRTAMLRVARREIKAVVRPMRQELRGLRRKLAGMPKTVSELSRNVVLLVRERDARRTTPQPDAAEARSTRFSGGLIQKLRRRLKLTQGQLALLAGVSVTAVRAWEADRSRPQGARRAALAAIRKLGRREAARVLAAKTTEVGRGRARRKARRRSRRGWKARRKR